MMYFFTPWPKLDRTTGQLTLFYPPQRGNVEYIAWNGRFFLYEGRVI